LHPRVKGHRPRADSPRPGCHVAVIRAWQFGGMPTKRSLTRATAETRARAKRLEEMGANGGLFLGAMIGTLFAAPRVNEIGVAKVLGIVAMFAAGGTILGALLVGWMMGAAANLGIPDYGDGGDGEGGGGDGE